MTYQEMQNAEEYLKENGWRFSADPNSWTGGYWWHDCYGFVTNQGGFFSRFAEATQAALRTMQFITAS